MVSSHDISHDITKRDDDHLLTISLHFFFAGLEAAYPCVLVKYENNN